MPFEGALLGVSLTALVAVSGSAIGAVWTFGQLDLVPIALVVGAIVGYRRATSVIATEHPIMAALGAGLRASLLGILVVWIIAIGPVVIERSDVQVLEVIGSLLFLAFYGLVLSLPVTIPIALVAVAVLRVQARREVRVD